MWGFSTEQNQPVRSFDDPFCLICPIGHKGWAQVNTAQAILSCWERTRHLPDPRPDLVEFQKQIKAIHAFLSNPEAIKKLETKHVMTQNAHSAPGKVSNSSNSPTDTCSSNGIKADGPYTTERPLRRSP